MESCYGNQVCCYTGNYAYCCKGITYGEMVGIAIGSLAGFVLLVVLIVVCCKVMNKNNGMKGRVIFPDNSTDGVAIVNSQQQGLSNGSYGANPGYGYGGQPLSPAYPPTGPYHPPSMYPPPKYSETDPGETLGQNH
ncbi:uncharacterized protein LOC133203777 [Saccostrea echinata]|uniref:uncharacterized protein LOC133203777 n=1 Tax=Saccostrea echinata TaxID=191078 RepID=UPI002A8205A0|nr:uncharacterized protein LOC133203777 [Saccostrea echinata]